MRYLLIFSIVIALIVGGFAANDFIQTEQRNKALDLEIRELVDEMDSSDILNSVITMQEANESENFHIHLFNREGELVYHHRQDMIGLNVYDLIPEFEEYRYELLGDELETLDYEFGGQKNREYFLKVDDLIVGIILYMED